MVTSLNAKNSVTRGPNQAKPFVMKALTCPSPVIVYDDGLLFDTAAPGSQLIHLADSAAA
jgi:hypothetical protein